MTPSSRRKTTYLAQITGLDSSKAYLAQFFVSEPRGNSWAYYNNGPFAASDGVNTDTESVSFGSGALDNLLVTVEASNTSSLSLTLPEGYGLGPGVSGVSGVVLHEVPEPSTFALIGVALVGLAYCGRRRK